MSAKNCRKRQETRHVTLDTYFKQNWLKENRRWRRKAIRNPFLRRKNAELLPSMASFQTFTKTVMKTRHVNCVALSAVHYTLCKTVTGSGARNEIRRNIKLCCGRRRKAVHMWKMLVILQLRIK
jgi:hypothetical protein